jgi:hypothetical protein
MPLGQYLKGAWLSAIFGGTAYPAIPGTLYPFLSTAPWASSTDAQILAAEPTGGVGGYTRPAVTNNGTNFAAVTVGAFMGSASSTNLQAGPGPTGVVSFATSTGTGWSSAGSFLVTAGWSDSATPGAGHVLWAGTPVNGSGVQLSLAVNQAGITLYYAANGFTTLLL